MTPEQIAARLSLKEKASLLHMNPSGAPTVNDRRWPQGALVRMGLATSRTVPPTAACLTPLGAAVRAVLEQEQQK